MHFSTCIKHSKGPLTYYVTLILAFLGTNPPRHTLSQIQNFPPTPNVGRHIMTFNRIFFCFHKNVFIMSFLASKWHQNRTARLFCDVKPNFFSKMVRSSIMKQNVLNIELFKKCDITLQKQTTHLLSQKSMALKVSKRV